MSRHRGGTSYGHRIWYILGGSWRLTWIVDYYYTGSRLRWPRSFRRETDEAGAKRFAKRWGICMPEAK